MSTPDTDTRTVYLCPKHGIIEQPSTYTEEDADGNVFNTEPYCPINLTGKAEAQHDGITDEVCGETVSGPHSANFSTKREAP